MLQLFLSYYIIFSLLLISLTLGSSTELTSECMQSKTLSFTDSCLLIRQLHTISNAAFFFLRGSQKCRK